MKVANLITTYKNPAQLERLIKSFNHHADFDFFIHLDGNVDVQEFLCLEKLDRVHLIRNRIKVVWGGFSFTQAILNSIEEIVSTGNGYDFINLMSSQDYPIKPINYIASYLDSKKGYSFLSYDRPEEEGWLERAAPRFKSYNFNDFTFKGRYIMQKIANQFLPERKFPLQYKMYGSSCASWWTLSTDCALYVTDFMKKNKGLNNFMKYTWGADEFLIPTIVMNSPFADKTNNDNLRYIDWSEGGSNPKVFTMKDFPALKMSEKLFARKFDCLLDSEVLNAIDQKILRTQNSVQEI